MSENLNRSNPDFSKYDSMSIGELEEILRADAQGPERDDSDVDEILYVMEVLAKKRQQNGIAGKTALEAYQEFQQHYRPMVEERSMPKHKSNIIPFRRIAAIAACLVLVFSFATSANAFCFRDVWNAVVTWAQETFSFSTGVEISEPKAESEIIYTSIQEVLLHNGINPQIAPLYIPEGYSLKDIKIDDTPLQETYLAIYTKNNEDILKISIQSFLEHTPEHTEVTSSSYEVYTIGNTDCYIISNNDQYRAVWLSDVYECNISGNITLSELKEMLDSIGKG